MSEVHLSLMFDSNLIRSGVIYLLDYDYIILRCAVKKEFARKCPKVIRYKIIFTYSSHSEAA